LNGKEGSGVLVLGLHVFLYKHMKF